MTEPTEPNAQLSFRMDDPIAALLEELRAAVRQAGHAKPSQKKFVQALIHGAPRDGAQLEAEVMVPYRKAFPDVDA